MAAYLLQYRNASGGLSLHYVASPGLTEAAALSYATAFVRANFVRAYQCGVIA